MMKRPFLDDWIARCCGLEVLSEESLRRYQLNKINEVLRYTERNSLLYRKRLAGVFERHGEAIRAGMWPASPDDVTQLPFTTARDLEDGWKRFVCVPLDAIARMVTLSTSGTTGEPKRLAFASADLERTLDFFAHGISVPVSGTGRPRSEAYSLKILRKLGGNLIPAGTENASPSACPSS